MDDYTRLRDSGHARAIATEAELQKAADEARRRVATGEEGAGAVLKLLEDHLMVRAAETEAIGVARQDNYGFLAKRYGGEKRPLEVCQSAAGFYIGTKTPEGAPNTRESAEYWRKRRDADDALAGRRRWSQRRWP